MLQEETLFLRKTFFKNTLFSGQKYQIHPIFIIAIIGITNGKKASVYNHGGEYEEACNLCDNRFVFSIFCDHWVRAGGCKETSFVQILRDGS